MPASPSRIRWRRQSRRRHGFYKMINFILWLVVGAIIGWAASSLMGTRNRLLLNIVVGSVGAFLAGFLLTPYLGMSTINQNVFSLLALMV